VNVFVSFSGSKRLCSESEFLVIYLKKLELGNEAHQTQATSIENILYAVLSTINAHAIFSFFSHFHSKPLMKVQP
jgi:hypothetical protein